MAKKKKRDYLDIFGNEAPIEPTPPNEPFRMMNREIQRAMEQARADALRGVRDEMTEALILGRRAREVQDEVNRHRALLKQYQKNTELAQQMRQVPQPQPDFKFNPFI